MINMESFRIKKVPASAFYIPNFITKEEEQTVLEKLYAVPKPKWVQLSNRRLQNWGGLPHPKGMFAEPIPLWLQNNMTKIDALGIFGNKNTNHVLVNEYLPGQGIMPHVDGPLFYSTITTINLGSHTLLDIYHPIEEEEDIELLDIYHPIEEQEDIEKNETEVIEKDGNSISFSSRKIGSLLLEPRSLLVLQDDMYTKFLHGIDEKKTDIVDSSVLNIDKISYSFGEILERKARVSLTIRHFPKVFKAKILGFGKKR